MRNIMRASVLIGLLCSVVVVLAFVREQRIGAPVIQGEKHIVVVVPSYNNSKWYQLNLSRIFDQKYSNYRVIYIDDCSDDNTGQLVEQFIKQSGHEHRVQLIKNKERKGAMYNLYQAIHSCDDKAIIITYDGDDWFKDGDALQTINRAYDDKNVWLTYGQFETFPGAHLGICHPMPDYIVNSHSYRKQEWFTSHLRTFYAGLFKKIKKEDMQDEKGNFYAVAWDQCFMFPMLEMARGRLKFIDKILYVYNQANPLNDFRVRCAEQLQCERVIRRKPAYEPLDEQVAKKSFVIS